ncbi:putative 3-hydroxybenzoate 6-monooxygenase [Helianthus annuus]|nr:putative 3-hydroxybenzoate 6-monooxygenase [Helianthus annuus]KAJ0617904.1 putative 3-hydroxybenzoate 6-monooxygenase [Helianthus annuus]
MDDNEDVVIIGAGICGLATALALHKKGLKGVAMERSESLRKVTGAGIAVRPNGWRALDQLGVAEILRHTAVPLKWERDISLDGGKQKETSL